MEPPPTEGAKWWCVWFLLIFLTSSCFPFLRLPSGSWGVALHLRGWKFMVGVEFFCAFFLWRVLQGCEYWTEHYWSIKITVRFRSEKYRTSGIVLYSTYSYTHLLPVVLYYIPGMRLNFPHRSQLNVSKTNGFDTFRSTLHSMFTQLLMLHSSAICMCYVPRYSFISSSYIIIIIRGSLERKWNGYVDFASVPRASWNLIKTEQFKNSISISH